MQGDEPLIDISDIKNLNFQTVNNNSDLATLACKIDTSKQDKYSNSNIVKVVTQEDLQKKSISRAVKFERIIDAKKNNYIYQHIGIYIYKKSILKKFVKLMKNRYDGVIIMDQFYVINCPKFIKSIYQFIKPFLHSDTRNKIKLIRENKTLSLENYI